MNRIDSSSPDTAPNAATDTKTDPAAEAKIDPKIDPKPLHALHPYMIQLSFSREGVGGR